MRKLLIIAYMILLVGCKAEENYEENYIEDESEKIVTDVYLSGIRYTIVSYVYVLEEYTYIYSSQYLFQSFDEENQSFISYTIIIDDIYYKYRNIDGEWINQGGGIEVTDERAKALYIGIGLGLTSESEYYEIDKIYLIPDYIKNELDIS